MPAERIGMRDAREIIPAEVFRRIDARDRPSSWRRPLNGAGDVEAGGDRRPRLALPGDMNDEALEGWTEERLDVSAMERLLAGMLANQLVEFYKALGPEMPAGLDLSGSDTP